MIPGISIVIPTVGRASLLRAVASAYAQQYEGEIQVLVGLDVDATGSAAANRKAIEDARPEHVLLNWIDPGYSTSARHGGVHSCAFGGSLRTALSFLAKHRHVMYLDDDDWLAPEHCRDMATAIGDKPWCHALCIYADGNTGQLLGVDLIESVGPGKGIYNERFGGFVRPSGLMIDKLQIPQVLPLWSHSPSAGGDCEDRMVFNALKDMEHGFTGRATVVCSLDPKDAMHALRMQAIALQTGAVADVAQKIDSLR